MSERTREWDLSELAGYVAAALTKASRDTDWPDDLNGNAARFLVQDLGEFAEAMVAAGRANYWSPAKALERLFIERVEVLMGVCVDTGVAKRYLDSVAKSPTEQRPNRPPRKARPEDALSTYLAKLSAAGVDPSSFRLAWRELKDLNSEWFVHPTVLGPLLSRNVREGNDEPGSHWVLLLELLAHGCVVTLAAANPLRIALPIEIVRAIHGVGLAISELGKADGRTLLEIHGAIAEKVVSL